MPATHDLTHAEAAEAFKAFAAEVGPTADVYADLNLSRYGSSERLRGAIYPIGIGRCEAIRAHADTYSDLLDALRNAWTEHGDTHAAKTIRDMALKIISLTADEGSCSEFSLIRAFSAAEVKAYGDRACEEATLISGNRPFSIVRGASEVEAA